MTQELILELSDRELLERFHIEQDPGALNEIARRYIGLVYSAARRQVRDAHLAEDITQAVFIVLVRNAGSIRRDAILPAWLFSVTRHAVANAMRVQSRRRVHETRKVLMSKLEEDQSPLENVAEDLRPHLDEAIARLPHGLRDSVILHFFGNRTHKQIGEELGITEDGARKRIGRALERMREILAGRGFGTTSAIAIASAMSIESAMTASAVPIGLLGSTVNIAMLSNTIGTASAATTIAKGVGHIMALTKIKIAAAVAGTIVIAGTAAMPLVSRAANYFSAPVAQTVVTTLIETNTAPTAGPTFVIEVNDKTKMEILGLTSYPPADDTWFAANGEPIDCPRPSFADAGHRIHAMPAPDHAIAIKIDKPDTTVVRMHIDGTTTMANMQMKDNDETVLLCAFNLNGNPQEFGFRLGIADGAWKTAAANENPKEESGLDAPGVGQVTFRPIEGDDNSCKVIADYPNIKIPNHIVVVDDTGKEYETTNINQQSDGQNVTTTCNFECPVDKVKAVLLQTRDFTRFVEATDVSLEKGHTTKPVLKVVEAKEGK